MTGDMAICWALQASVDAATDTDARRHRERARTFGATPQQLATALRHRDERLTREATQLEELATSR